MNLRIAAQYIFSLALACQACASITFDEAQTALDLPAESDIYVTVPQPIALDSDARSGAKSLALTYTPENPSGYISLTIRGTARQNSIIEFYLKKRAIPDFNISALIERSSLNIQAEQPDAQGWQKIAIPIDTESSKSISITLGMPATESENAALLIDQLSITAGNWLNRAPHRGGSLVLSPSKIAYATGDVVTITALPMQGFRINQIMLTHENARGGSSYKPLYRETTSDSISHMIQAHSRVEARYDAAIPCLGGSAWSIGAPDEYGQFTGPPEDYVQEGSVEGLTQAGVLAFDVLSPRNTTLEFVPQSGLTNESKSLTIIRDEENFVPVHVAFETAPQTIHWGGQFQTALKIRNLRFVTAPQAFTSQIGHGTVSVEHQTNLDGQTSATLTATPAEGWIFLGWRAEEDGEFLATQPTATFELKHARTFQALFGQSFQADGRTLAFVHSGVATIAIQESPPGKTIYTIHNPNLNFNSPERPIELFIFDLPPGSIQGSGTYVFDSQTLISPAFPNPFRYPLTLTPGYWEPNAFHFQHTPLAELSAALNIIAPPDSIDAPLPPFAYGQTVELSVNPAFRSRFVGWRGDLYSDKAQIAVSADNNKKIAAVFEYEIPFDSPIAMKWHSPHSTSTEVTQNTLQATIDGSFESILSGHVDGPCILKFNRIGTGNVSPTRIVLPNQLPGYSESPHSYTSGSEIRLPITSAGDFSITFSGSETPESFQLQFAGVYQRVEKSYDNRGGNLFVDQYGNGEFLVGSSIQFQFVPYENYTLLGWIEPNIPTDTTSLPVELYKNIQLTPEVVYNSGSSQLLIHSSNLETWDYNSTQKSFSSKQTFVTGQSENLSLHIQGPGALEISLYETYDIEAYADGQRLEPVLRFGPPPDTRKFEYLLPDGESEVELKIKLTGPSSYFTRLQVESFNFAPGYALRKKHNALGDATLTPAASNHTYTPGSSVTLNAASYSGNSFQSWQGDATGANSSTQVLMDRHRIVAPTYRPTAALSSTRYTTSANANILATSYENSTAFEVAGSTQPVTFTFTIPPKFEFKFDLSGSFSGAALWSVPGQAPREVYAGSSVAAAPASSERSATLRVEIDLESSEFLRLSNLLTRDKFILGGDFGAYTEQVRVDPSRESYGWGVKVKILLDSSLPNSSRFYDLATEYDGYDQIDWTQPDFVREYQVEIKGDTYVIGKVGPTFTRTVGQITSYPEESNRASSITDPYGRASREVFANAVHRIQTGGARFVTFFIKIPENDFLLLDSFSGNTEIPIQGTGEWMQVGMPVPAGRTFVYFNIVDNGGSYLDTNYIAGVQALSGYAPPFLSFGPGQITVEPASGAASPSGNVTLRATPNATNVSHLWLTPNESEEPTITAKANDPLPIFVYFEEPEINPTSPLLPFNLTAIGTVPYFYNQTDPSQNQRIEFRETPISLVRPVEGPSTLLIEAHISSQANLELKIGAATYRIFRPDYNGVQAFYYAVPAGVTEVQLNYTSNTYFPSTLNNLQEIDAFIVEAQSPNATVSIFPNKPYYQTGDVVNAYASPNDGFAFKSWNGSSTSAANPLQITINGHTSLTAKLEEIAPVNPGNLNWLPRPSENETYTYETIVQGPGALYLASTPSSGSSLQIDGLAAKLHPTLPSHSYFLIPSGKHRLRLTQSQTQRAAPAIYVPGFRIDLSSTSINHSFKISPKQTAYHAGEHVTIDWPESLVPPNPDLPIFLEPFAQTVTLPHSFTVQDHVVGQAYALLPTAAESLLASDMYRLTNYIDTVSDLTGKNLAEGLGITFNHTALHLKLTEGGTLRFTYKREAYYQNSLGSVKLDGQRLLDLEHGKTYQLNIPSTGGLVTWNTTADNPWNYGISYLADLQFTPHEQPDAFTTSLENKAPLTAFATSLAIGPDDDLDSDGATNRFEINRGTNPGVFDLWIWTSEGDETPAATLARFNQQKTSASRLQTLPNKCIELTLAAPIETASNNTGSKRYALTILPANTPLENLSVQLGYKDPETRQIQWTRQTLVPTISHLSTAPSPRLIRLEIRDLSTRYPLVRFVHQN